MSTPYLPAGLPAPPPDPEGLTRPYWDGLRRGKLLVQRCAHCGAWQFGPEWLCHRCHTFGCDWVEVDPHGLVYSWERIWHPVHPVLQKQGPYLACLVELPHAGAVRMLGNLLGDPLQEVRIGAPVQGVFEHHGQEEPPYSLLQWRLAGT
ncbi:MAG: OB-fold domain-containing protein [Pseudomonadota bacterium]